MVARTLEDLLEDVHQAAASLPAPGSEWLLEASNISKTVAEMVLSDPFALALVRDAVKNAAVTAGCDLIVGASSVAQQVVAELGQGLHQPVRAFLFELVRVTGTTLELAQAKLSDIDVVQAALLNIDYTESHSEVVVVRSTK